MLAACAVSQDLAGAGGHPSGAPSSVADGLYMGTEVTP
jgi:hypothetical protein